MGREEKDDFPPYLIAFLGKRLNDSLHGGKSPSEVTASKGLVEAKYDCPLSTYVARSPDDTRFYLRTPLEDRTLSWSLLSPCLQGRPVVCTACILD